MKKIVSLVVFGLMFAIASGFLYNHYDQFQIKADTNYPSILNTKMSEQSNFSGGPSTAIDEITWTKTYDNSWTKYSSSTNLTIQGANSLVVTNPGTNAELVSSIYKAPPGTTFKQGEWSAEVWATGMGYEDKVSSAYERFGSSPDNMSDWYSTEDVNHNYNPYNVECPPEGQYMQLKVELSGNIPEFDWTMFGFEFSFGGFVSDSTTKNGIIGANVIIRGVTTQTQVADMNGTGITDQDGWWGFDSTDFNDIIYYDPNNLNYSITISKPGYQTRTISLTAKRCDSGVGTDIIYLTPISNNTSTPSTPAKPTTKKPTSTTTQPSSIPAVSASTPVIVSSINHISVVNSSTNIKLPSGGSFNITGKANPNVSVKLYIYSNPITATVKADANGDWSYILPKTLAVGQHHIEASIVDTNGVESAKTTVAQFSIANPITTTTITKKPIPLWVYGLMLVALILLGTAAFLYIKKKRHSSVTKKISANI
jgi:hypothetical protein